MSETLNNRAAFSTNSRARRSQTTTNVGVQRGIVWCWDYLSFWGCAIERTKTGKQQSLLKRSKNFATEPMGIFRFHHETGINYREVAHPSCRRVSWKYALCYLIWKKGDFWINSRKRWSLHLVLALGDSLASSVSVRYTNSSGGKKNQKHPEISFLLYTITKKVWSFTDGTF